MTRKERLRKAAIAEHFSSTVGPAIHLYLEGTSSEVVDAEIRETAQALGYHLAILNGDPIKDKRALLRELGSIYDFPKLTDTDYERLNWDSAADWLDDLMWLTGWPDESNVPGFLLLYREPLSLFDVDAVDFAIFLDIVATAAAVHREAGLPFHMLVGPLSHKAISLVSVLKTEYDFCAYWREDWQT